MSWFRDLKVFHKINLILVAYAISMVITLIIGRSAQLDTHGHLIALEQEIYDSVQIASVNRPLLKRADELLTQAVSFGEQELKEQGEQAISTLLSNLEELKQIDPEHADNISVITNQVNSYRNVAVPIVEEMLGGEPDFSQLQTKISRKAELFEAINLELEAFHKRVNGLFKENLHEAIEHGQKSLIMTSAVNALFFVIIAALIVVIARTISNTANEIRNSLDELSQGEGDLSYRIQVNSGDELGMAARNFNHFMAKLGDTVEQIQHATHPLVDAANELNSNARTVEQATKDLLDKAHEGKTSMGEITLSISEISQSATQASDAMKETDTQANQGLEIVQSTIDKSESLNAQIIDASAMVERLANDTDNVADILNVISSIAEQTNLLALNAAIEAARAGEQGRGFAVVADEVRALASKTADATTEIREVLARLEDTASSTVSAMHSAKDQSLVTQNQAVETGEALNQIKASIEQVNSMSLTIASATEQQSIVAGNVGEIINNMYESSATTERAYGELAQLADKLVGSSDTLKQASGQFKL